MRLTGAVIAVMLMISCAQKQCRSEDRLEAVQRLQDFLHLQYSTEDMKTAYNEYFSASYRSALKLYRGVADAEAYVNSNPSIDFEFITTLERIFAVHIVSNRAVIEAETSVHDVVKNRIDSEEQTFVMAKEDGKWVYVF